MFKTRIERIGPIYYPQYKKLFMWQYFFEEVGYDNHKVIKFDTLKEANDFVCEKQQEFFYPKCKKD